MNQRRLHNEAPRPPGALRDLMQNEDWPSVSILYSLLDAHLLFEETGLAPSALEPSFKVWWPEASLEQTLEGLCESKLLTAHAGPHYAVAKHLQPMLSAELGIYLGNLTVCPPAGECGFAELIDDFTRYCRSELQGIAPTVVEAGNWQRWAFSSAGRIQYLLVRPFPLRLHAHPDAYILALCRLPEAGIETLTRTFVSSPALRQRLALFDLQRAEKINLTRGDLFVHFERYLRRVHCLRLAPCPAFSQGLEDGGLLSLRMG